MTPLRTSPYIARMAKRDILILPDKRLRLKSEPVATIDKSLRALVDDMFETMYEAPGIGLAAIQIGVPQRVVTMDLAKKDEPKAPQVFINPEVTWNSDEKAAYEEGCLSIPEYYEEVERPAAVRSNISTSTASRTRSRRAACSPPACSTRSTTPTACCSSTTFPSSSATW